MGGAAGLLMRNIYCANSRLGPEDRGFCVERGKLEVTLIGTLSGAIVGGLLGQLIKSDRWMPMPLERFPKMP
jgi:hypothetical protein